MRRYAPTMTLTSSQSPICCWRCSTAARRRKLEESSDEETLISPTPSEEQQERRKVIKNKILAVGRMSRVFALLRYAPSTFTLRDLY